MPNWCDNRLLVDGEPSDILGFARFVSSDSAILDFEKAMPIPTCCVEGADIRDWCTENWGTKWSPDCEAPPTDDQELTRIFSGGFYFLTAWTPPIQFFNRIAELFPNVSIHLDYLEMGCAFAGETDWVNGENAGDCEYNHWDDAYKRLAIEVFNYDD